MVIGQTLEAYLCNLWEVASPDAAGEHLTDPTTHNKIISIMTNSRNSEGSGRRESGMNDVNADFTAGYTLH